MSGAELLGSFNSSFSARLKVTIGSIWLTCRKRMLIASVCQSWRTLFLDASWRSQPYSAYLKADPAGRKNMFFCLHIELLGMFCVDACSGRTLNLLQEHWDTCEAAGRSKRPASPFEESLPQLKYLCKDGGKPHSWIALHQNLSCHLSNFVQQ